MQIRELHLSELSELGSRVFRCEFGGKHNPEALIFEFAGKYGYGSDGNRDAAYMKAIRSAWLSICNVNAVVFDLRHMEYEWGNSIWNVFKWGDDDEEVELAEGEPRLVFPTAIVVSELCKKGFLTCSGVVPPMFDDLGEALHSVEAPARQYLEVFFRWLDSNGSTHH